MAVNNNVGWGFPFRFEEGRVKSVGGSSQIIPQKSERDRAARDRIRRIILTNKGDRVMLYQFGLSAQRMLFQPIGATLVTLIPQNLREQLSWWNKSVTLTKVTTSAEYAAGKLLFGLTIIHNELQVESVMKLGTEFK